MPAIHLMTATPADVDQITVCIAAAYAKVRETLADIPDVTSGIARDVLDHRVIVARDESGLVGVIIFAQQGDAMKIINLAVSPTAQGQGVAGQLLAQARSEAQANQCTHMVLRTHRMMQDTRSIYAHLGWIETEVAGNTVSLRLDLPS